MRDAHHIGLVGALVLMIVFTGCSGDPPDIDSLRSVIQTELKTGMSVERFEQLMGEGYRPNDMEKKVLAYSMKNASNPDMAPNGYEDGDEFYGYPLGEIKAYFQFRNGKLINFNPEIY